MDYGQVVRHMDRLGVSEGWLVVADSDLTKPWDEKISSALRIWPQSKNRQFSK